MDRSFDTVIVGSGIGGLIAANYLLSQGKNVLLVEKNAEVGGYCSSFIADGYLFDGAATMVSGLGGNGYVRQVFDEIGLCYQDELIVLDTYEKMLLTGEEFLIPAAFQEFMGLLKERFPEDAAGLDKFIELTLAIVQDMDKINSWTTPIVKNIQLFPKSYPVLFAEKNTSLEDILARYFTNEILKNLFRAQCFRVGLIPQTTSFINFAGNWYYTYSTPPTYLRGGIGRLAGILAEGVRAKGGVLLTEAECVKILIEDSRAVGIELRSGEVYRAQQVVSNVDATATHFQLVGREHWKKIVADKVERLVVSPSAFIMYLGIDGDLAEMGLAMGDLWYFSEKCFDPANSLEEQSFGWNRLYFSSPAVKDVAFQRNGQGGSSLMIIKTTPYLHTEHWAQHAEEYAKEVLNFAERVLPGLQARITYMHYATPVDLERRTGNRQGAVAGWAPIPLQSGFLRMTRDTAIAGLYLTGHWTAPGPGVMACVVSGMKVGQLILEEGR